MTQAPKDPSDDDRKEYGLSVCKHGQYSDRVCGLCVDQSEEIDEILVAAKKHYKNLVARYGNSDFLAVHIFHAFQTGADFGEAIGAVEERERILGILRGDKFDKYLRDNAINELDPFYFSDWLEKELK